jgi:glycosyltransferase 2 family protein
VIRRSFWAWARPLGGLAILGVVVWRLGAGPFLDGLRAVSVEALLAALTITAVTTVCSAWRWQVVARGLGIALRLHDAVAAYYRSQFLNSALPGGVLGDVHRGVRTGADTGDVGRGLRAVMWERIAGQVVQGVLVLVVLLAFGSPVPAVVWWAAAGTGAVLLAIALAVRVVRRDVRAGLLGRRAWPVVLGTSVVVAAGHSATFLIAAWTTGATAPLATLLPLTMLVLVAMIVPFTVGGWGPREGVAAWAFGAAGLGAAQGVATATAYGVMGLAATLPGLLVLAADRRSRAASRLAPGADVEAEQDVVPGEVHRPVGEPDPLGHPVGAQRADRVDARADDRG